MITVRLIARLGYNDYLVSPEDALALLQIAQRLVRVTKPAYDRPWQRAEQDTQPICTGVSYEEVELPDPPTEHA